MNKSVRGQKTGYREINKKQLNSLMTKAAKAYNHMTTPLKMLRREYLSSLALLQSRACSLDHELKIVSLILLLVEVLSKSISM